MPTTPTPPKSLEDYLVYLFTYGLPIITALAGFNWASLIPGNNNAFLVAVAFGFLAKFLVGIQQNGWKSWEDWIPTAMIVATFLTTALSANPMYLTYGTIAGFIVKALGYFTDTSHPIEDILLAVGAFLALYGAYIGNQQIVNLGAVIALIGKTIPSMVPQSSTKLAPAVPAPTPASAPTPTPAPAPSASSPATKPFGS